MARFRVFPLKRIRIYLLLPNAHSRKKCGTWGEGKGKGKGKGKGLYTTLELSKSNEFVEESYFPQCPVLSPPMRTEQT